MIKELKSVLCFLLACSLLILSACSKNGAKEETNKQPGEGRYVETEISPPIDGQFVSFLTADGAIVCYDTTLQTKYKSTDGGASWQKEPAPDAGSGQFERISAGTLLQDGSLLVFIQDAGFFTIAPDGGSTPYPMPDIDALLTGDQSVMLSAMQALPDDRLLLSYTTGGFVRTTQGGRENNAAPGGGSTGNAEDVPDANAAANENAEEAAGAENEKPDDPVGGESAQPQAPANAGPQAGGPQTGGSRAAGGGTSRNIGGAMENKTCLYSLATGQLIAELSAGNAIAATSDGESLYVMDSNGNIAAYNLNDGKPAGQSGISLGNGDTREGMAFIGNGMSNVLTRNAGGELYAAFDKNVMSIDTAGNVQTILESTNCSIGAPRSNINAVLAPGDGSILVNVATGNQQSHLYKYVWDENAVSSPDKMLTVWSLEDNAFVRAAIAELRKNHPDATISYEVALEGESASSASDAIKTLNTRLLNGTGPDVIILDGCPAESYAGKGILLDLKGLLNTGDVYENLLAPYTTEGKLYYLPAQFQIPALMGSAEALAKASNLDSLVELVVTGKDTAAGRPSNGSDPFSGLPEEERAALYFDDLRELCEVLWLASAPVIVSENQLNTQALQDYLKAVKAISDKYKLTEEGQGNRMRARMGFSDGGAVTTVPASLMRYTMQQTNYGAFTAGNLQLLQMMMERVGSELIPLPGLTSGAWQPSTITGISAGTNVQEFAAAFLQTMLSLEVQQLNYGTGLPITRQGIAAQITAINERLAEDDREVRFTFDADAFIRQLKTPSMSDVVLTDMMWDSVEKCCKGEIDVEGAVKVIEQNVKNYLAERA